MSVAPRALDYLFSLEQFGIKFGLDNMQALVEALDHPERAYPTVHIAGTNGKGSVSAMVDSALRAAGHRSGRYTSPHLVDVSERFVIDGLPVDPETLDTAADTVRVAIDRLLESGRLLAPPTFFEATTAVALTLFRDAHVGIAVCEVGLGGRLDATNVIAPAVTAITSIGYDHQQYLGSTLAAIAAEKAGIIKTHTPVVVGEVPDEARAVIQSIAAERGAPLIEAAATIASVLDGWRDGAAIVTLTGTREYGSIRLALAGQHQIGNARVATRVLELLDATGVRVPASAVREGLERVEWPGRLDRRRLPDGRDLLMDAAHNPEGAQALAAFLASEPGEPRALVFGAMRDKDVADMLRVLAPHVRALIMTKATTDRSAEPAALAAMARGLGIGCPILVEPQLASALEVAWRMTPRAAVAGSIFLLGDVMKLHGWS